MPESMDKAEVDRIVAQLREPRPCKVCGTVFRPERLTAVLCSTTCQQRSHRGGDFMYIDRLTTEAARAGARRLHENVDALINRVGEHNRAIRERLSERTSDEAIGRQVRIIWGIGRGRTKSPPGASSPEIAAVIEKTYVLKKIYQTWRLAVTKAFDDLPKADRGNHQAIFAAIHKALSHIPAEAIAVILKTDEALRKLTAGKRDTSDTQRTAAARERRAARKSHEAVIGQAARRVVTEQFMSSPGSSRKQLIDAVLMELPDCPTYVVTALVDDVLQVRQKGLRVVLDHFADEKYARESLIQAVREALPNCPDFATPIVDEALRRLMPGKAKTDARKRDTKDAGGPRPGDLLDAPTPPKVIRRRILKEM